MSDDDIRLLILQQRKLFGSYAAMAAALDISTNNLKRFVAGRQGLTGAGMHHSKLLRALGLEIVEVRVLLKPSDEL